MDKPLLIPASPLGGYDRTFGATRLAEVADLATVAAAIPQGGEAEAEEAFRVSYFCRLPASGRYTISDDGATSILRNAPDQVMLMFRHLTPDALAVVRAALGETLWLTDLSDTFCALDLDGPGARAALERICPLDLDPSVFREDHAARTLMEHMPATILRTGDNAFRLLAARSTARDFLHAAEEALGTVT